MVNHRIHEFVKTGVPSINGHQPKILYNENTRRERMVCDTCHWVGPAQGPRHRKDIFETWMIHVREIAWGNDLSHGRIGYPCECWDCRRATNSDTADAGRVPEAGGQ